MRERVRKLIIWVRVLNWKNVVFSYNLLLYDLSDDYNILSILLVSFVWSYILRTSTSTNTNVIKQVCNILLFQNKYYLLSTTMCDVKGVACSGKPTESQCLCSILASYSSLFWFSDWSSLTASLASFPADSCFFFFLNSVLDQKTAMNLLYSFRQ